MESVLLIQPDSSLQRTADSLLRCNRSPVGSFNMLQNLLSSRRSLARNAGGLTTLRDSSDLEDTSLQQVLLSGLASSNLRCSSILLRNPGVEDLTELWHIEGNTSLLDKWHRRLALRLHTLQEDKEWQFPVGMHVLLDICQQFCLQPLPVWKGLSCLRQKDSDIQLHKGLWKW